jgi:Fe-S-cluster-containing hydrogenase component 2
VKCRTAIVFDFSLGNNYKYRQNATGARPARGMEIRMVKTLRIVPQKCTGCMQCELACSWIQTGTFQPSRSVIRVNVFDEEASYAPYTCVQCNEAWCMNACPVNAIAIDPVTQAKIVLERLCVGCHLCTIACPFGTVFTLPQSKTAAKCNLCAGDPACASVCPTGAIEFVQTPEPGDWFGPWGANVTQRHRAALAATT